MEQEYIDIDQKQYLEIGEIIEKLREKNFDEREVEIKFGEENSNEKEDFKCVFSLNNYNETTYSYIKETAVAYHISKNEAEGLKSTVIHFYLGSVEVDKYVFNYNQEMIQELNGPIKK